MTGKDFARNSDLSGGSTLLRKSNRDDIRSGFAFGCSPGRQVTARARVTRPSKIWCGISILRSDQRRFSRSARSGGIDSLRWRNHPCIQLLVSIEYCTRAAKIHTRQACILHFHRGVPCNLLVCFLLHTRHILCTYLAPAKPAHYAEYVPSMASDHARMDALSTVSRITIPPGPGPVCRHAE